MNDQPTRIPHGLPAPAASGQHLLNGMSEAARPTGPILGTLVAVLIIMLGQLPFAPLLSGVSTTTFSGQLMLTLSFLLPLLLFFAWVRFRERRPVASLGFRSPVGKDLAVGAMLGVGFTSLIVLVNVVAGTATLGELTWSALPPAVILLGGFAIQSSTEEVANRGYILQAVTPRWGFAAAMAVQTLVFALFHGANGGLTWVAWGNLAGVAVFLGMWVWVTGRLWVACAFHTMWNWSQGNLFGAPVSHTQVGTSVGHYTPVEGASALLTGGSFGLEGSVIPLVCFVVGSAVLYNYGRRR